MSRSIDRHRMKMYKNGLDSLMGDDTAQNAQLALQALSELSKGAGNIVSVEAANRQASSKKKALDDANRNLINAKATMAKADATEKDKSGPLHLAAQKQLIDAQAAVDALSTDYLSQLSLGQGKNTGAGMKKSAEPWWKWPAIALGVGTVGLVGYKLVSSKRK